MVADVSAHPPILPVILAGGVGSRLAPISTPECPKPFVPWTNDHCLYRQTIDRVSPHWLPPLVIGREPDRFRLLNHLRDAGAPYTGILLESHSLNTGLAVALVAAWLERHASAPVTLALLPADHRIHPAGGWQQAIHYAAAVASDKGQHCLLSTPARWPESGYGYIEAGDSDSISDPTITAFPIRRFIEKPVEPAPLIAQGMQWNTGQCIVTLHVLLQLLHNHALEYIAAARSMVAHSERCFEFDQLAPPHVHHATLEALPFDRIILEKSDGYVVPMEGEWCDMGTPARWHQHAGAGRGTARTDRPWGYFELLAQDKTHILKKLTIYPGARLSLQKHQYRDEHWQVLDGTAQIVCGTKDYTLERFGEIHIPASSWHRLENIGTKNLIIIEKQIGKCLEEDILRKEDDYGRA